jgi:membrane protease YdiL (CAAX protease family)
MTPRMPPLTPAVDLGPRRRTSVDARWTSIAAVVVSGFSLGSGSSLVALWACVLTLAAGAYAVSKGANSIIAAAPAILSLATLVQSVSGLSWRIAFILLLAAGLFIWQDGRPEVLKLAKRLVAPPRVTMTVLVMVVVSLVVGSALLSRALGDEDTLIVFGPQLPIGLLLAAALLNAVLEEFIWRGLLTCSLEKLGAGVTSTSLSTSLSFGLAHFSGGYPAGVVGSALAAALGLVTSFLARRSGSLMLPVGLHAAFDVMILAHIYGS